MSYCELAVNTSRLMSCAPRARAQAHAPLAAVFCHADIVGGLMNEGVAATACTRGLPPDELTHDCCNVQRVDLFNTLWRRCDVFNTYAQLSHNSPQKYVVNTLCEYVNTSHNSPPCT